MYGPCEACFGEEDAGRHYLHVMIHERQQLVVFGVLFFLFIDGLF